MVSYKEVSVDNISCRSSTSFTRIADMGKLAEIRSNFRQMINLFHQCFCHIRRQFFHIRRLAVICFLQILNAQLHGRQRIFDFMCNLPRHFPPGTFPFTFCQCRCTFHQLVPPSYCIPGSVRRSHHFFSIRSLHWSYSGSPAAFFPKSGKKKS